MNFRFFRPMLKSLVQFELYILYRMLVGFRDVLVYMMLFSLLKRPFIILYMAWMPLLKSEVVATWLFWD